MNLELAGPYATMLDSALGGARISGISQKRPRTAIARVGSPAAKPLYDPTRAYEPVVIVTD